MDKGRINHAGTRVKVVIAALAEDPPGFGEGLRENGRLLGGRQGGVKAGRGQMRQRGEKVQR